MMSPLSGSPFSGLSLIAHLSIIGGGSLVLALRKRFPWLFVAISPRDKSKKSNHDLSKRIMSLFIMVTIILVMGYSLIMALAAGWRAGSEEWHMQFASEQLRRMIEKAKETL
ncbi:hypothetical protein C4552_03415 [Candidatus Parcubacteria bacterium]|nr:MAG: hypothetical protein C4552_03415 [Candidatus Parcubacteria bacterium]